MIIAFLALGGWYFQAPSLRSWLAGTVSMNPLTALCIVLCGCLLLGLESSRSGHLAWKAGAGLVIGVSGLHFFDSLLGLGFDYDRLLPVALGVDFGGIVSRMAPNAALSIFQLSLSMVLVRASGTLARVGQLLLLLNLAGLFFTLLGYAYGVELLYRVVDHIPMALNSAVALTLLTIGVGLVTKGPGVLDDWSGASLGGQLARRLLPWMLVIPLLGWMAILGGQKGWVDGRTGITLLVVLGMGAWCAVVLATAHSMNKADLERIAAEQALAAHARDLKAAQAELEAFSYTVSHDLRAPLRHINGFMQLLQKGLASPDPKTSRYMNLINESAVQMGNLIDGLLNFSRLARTELMNSEVDLDQMVKDLFETVSHHTGQRVIHWKKGELGRVRGDGGMLRQVILNLIENAVKYSRLRPEAIIEIFVRKDRDLGLVVAVRDNGAGFDPAYTDKLFGVFQRLHTNEEFEGTGIGLANVRRIITRHGGKTWAEGELNKGATFYFSLPQERILE